MTEKEAQATVFRRQPPIPQKLLLPRPMMEMIDSKMRESAMPSKLAPGEILVFDANREATNRIFLWDFNDPISVDERDFPLKQVVESIANLTSGIGNLCLPRGCGIVIDEGGRHAFMPYAIELKGELQHSVLHSAHGGRSMALSEAVAHYFGNSSWAPHSLEGETIIVLDEKGNFYPINYAYRVDSRDFTIAEIDAECPHESYIIQLRLAGMGVPSVKAVQSMFTFQREMELEAGLRGIQVIGKLEGNQCDRRVPTASSGVCAHSVTNSTNCGRCEQRGMNPQFVNHITLSAWCLSDSIDEMHFENAMARYQSEIFTRKEDTFAFDPERKERELRAWPGIFMEELVERGSVVRLQMANRRGIEIPITRPE